MKTLPVLAIVSAVVGAIGAIVFVDPAQLLLGFLAVALGVVAIVMHRALPGFVVGGASIVLGILGSLWVIGSIGGEDGEVGFGASPEIGHAVLVFTMLATVGLLLWVHFHDIAMWAKGVGIASLVLTLVLALVFNGQLGDQSAVGGFVVAAAALAGIVVPIERMRA